MQKSRVGQNFLITLLIDSGKNIFILTIFILYLKFEYA